MAKKNPTSCPSGKRLVKFKGRSFCARKGKKGGKRSGKLGGIASLGQAQRKAMTRKACKKPGVRAKMPGLCKWAGA